MEDEEMDRLFLLGEEFELQNPSGTTVLATTRAAQTGTAGTSFRRLSREGVTEDFFWISFQLPWPI